jgi:hypothetical protein
MKHCSSLLFLLLLVLLGYAQPSVYRYATISNRAGSTFYALDGSTGQLRYLNDYKEANPIWQAYGGGIRPMGRNSLEFAPLQFENGVVFYAIEASTGQLYFMPDYGDHSGVWASYGSPIRATGRDNLRFASEHNGEGCKFTAIDGDTGQIYYMFDSGDNAGIWKAYAGVIK